MFGMFQGTTSIAGSAQQVQSVIQLNKVNTVLNSKPVELLEGTGVGAIKVATEGGSNLLSSKEVTMAAKPRHLQAPSCPYNTEKEIPGCGIDTCTYPNMWEGKASKQASRAKLQQNTWQCPCRVPWTPSPN